MGWKDATGEMVEVLYLSFFNMKSLSTISWWALMEGWGKHNSQFVKRCIHLSLRTPHETAQRTDMYGGK